MRPPLPIDAVLPALIEALRTSGAAVLLAPPGAGKTTRVPPAILDAGLADSAAFPNGRVLVLQPRRVAARAAARRIAAERGGTVGGEIGYRVRFEDRTGPDTRIELLTEGLLTRRLQSDPFLEGVGCVIFDEFHERSLHADLGLALLREVRRDVRPDLRLVVMSATLDPGPIALWLDAPVIRAEGRAFPVEIRYAPLPDDRPLAVRVAAAIRAALAADAADDPGGDPGGDVLVFLPGVGEIERTTEALGTLTGPLAAEVIPLHGRLSPEAQDRALAPHSGRRVVLATNIAETSITLDGVTTVIDTGLARAPRFDPAIGLERLERVRISRASADQRAGRAGRTRPGRCHRLWTESENRGLLPYDAPEITRVDLTRAVLDVRAWGVDPRTFGWFEPPPRAAIDAAEQLLRSLGALDDRGVTPLGETLLALPVHPRLGRVIIAGHAQRALHAAATAAALAAERDIFTDPPALTADSDLEVRIDALRAADRGRPPRGIDRRALAEVRDVRDQLVRVATATLGPARDHGRDHGRDQSRDHGRDHARTHPDTDPATLARLLLTGFPDRVALRRAPRSDRFKLASGAGARLAETSAVRDAPLIIAVTLRGARRGERTEHHIDVATALDPAWLPVTEAITTRFDPTREAVIQTRTRRYLALVLDEAPAGDAADPEAITDALAHAVAADPRAALQWPDDPATTAYLHRLRWLAQTRPALNLPTWPELEPHAPPSPFIRALCAGRKSFAELRRIALVPLLDGHLPHPARQTLAREAPPRLTLPDGTQAAIEYTPGQPPVLATRFERLFGLADTPTIAGIPVMLHLLAPNQRPVQITSDLRSFWYTTYAQVRRELRGRYPKHPWPEDPWTAQPGIKRRPT